MPVCLTCGHQFTLYYTKGTPILTSHLFIEECWCGGYVISRDLISEIHNKNKSLRKTMHLFQLDGKLDQSQEQEMINYAIVQGLLEDNNLRYYIGVQKRQRPIQYLMKIVEYVLEGIKKNERA